MARFTIEHLNDEQLLEAWPVVRMSNAHANSGWWVSESAALIDRGGGILAVRAPDGTIHGIATYEVANKAVLGRVLAVETLVTFELSRRAPARHALYDALELLAGAFACRSIVLPIQARAHLLHRTKTITDLLDFRNATEHD